MTLCVAADDPDPEFSTHPRISRRRLVITLYPLTPSFLCEPGDHQLYYFYQRCSWLQFPYSVGLWSGHAYCLPSEEPLLATKVLQTLQHAKRSSFSFPPSVTPRFQTCVASVFVRVTAQTCKTHTHINISSSSFYCLKERPE